MYNVSAVQLLSHVWLFETPWTAACQASLSITNSWSLLKLLSIESVMTSNHLILCCPLLLPSNFPSIRIFSNVSSSHQMAKILKFQLQHQSFQWIFRTDILWMNWLDLLAVQGTLKSLLQHHSSNTSIFWHSAFFMLSKNASWVKDMDDLSHSAHCYMSLYLKNIAMTLCQNQQLSS